MARAIKDRLYGELVLPEIASNLAQKCPVLLRLREVRMANIPFSTYPSFTHVDRYEHSLGVAHLTWRWGRKNRLPEDEATALTVAALYHDGGTPAFGHLFEEFLSRYGFDHEAELVNLILGKTDLPGRQDAQVFLGRTCKLHDSLRPYGLSPSLTPLSIARLLEGRGSLGRLIKGDIDFDNIDNVVRAFTAMGLQQEQSQLHPYEVCDALILEDGEIRVDPAKAFAIEAWKSMRRMVYEEILRNPLEFRAQTAFKWAIEECSKTDERLRNPVAWTFTEPELTFNLLRANPFSRHLVDRVRLGNPPDLLFALWVEDLEKVTTGSGRAGLNTLCLELKQLTNQEVYVNYYLDKRERSILLPRGRPRSLFATAEPETEHPATSNGNCSGMLGAVSVSRFERKADSIPPEPATPAAIDVSEETIVEMVERILGTRVVDFSFGRSHKAKPSRQRRIF